MCQNTVFPLRHSAVFPKIRVKKKNNNNQHLSLLFRNDKCFCKCCHSTCPALRQATCIGCCGSFCNTMPWTQILFRFRLISSTKKWFMIFNIICYLFLSGKVIPLENWPRLHMELRLLLLLHSCFHCIETFIFIVSGLTTIQKQKIDNPPFKPETGWLFGVFTMKFVLEKYFLVRCVTPTGKFRFS